MLRNVTLARSPEVDSLNSNEEDTRVDNSIQESRRENMREHDSADSMCPKCGDMQPIAREFRQHYEKKLRELCDDNNQECVQAKMKLQEDWIRDLTEQNEMLLKAVIELESEATQRVKMLEAQLKESEECNCEVMNGWKRGRVDADDDTQEQLASDVRTLLKLLRRSRISASVCARELTADLHFHHVSAQELSDALDSTDSVPTDSHQASQEVGLVAGDNGSHKLRVSLEILEASCGYNSAAPACSINDNFSVQINHTEPFAFPPAKTRPLPTKFSYSQQH